MVLATGNAAQDRGPGLVISNMVLMTLAILAIGLRFLSRAIAPSPNAFTSRFWWDDWLALAATPFIITLLVLVIPSCQMGLGKHISEFQLKNAEPLGVIFLSEYYIGVTGTFLARESAIFFLTRIFNRDSQSKRLKIGINTMHALNVAWLVSFYIVISCLCIPIQKFWNPSLPGRCMSRRQMLIPKAISALILDTIVLVYPMPLIYRMQLSFKQKMGLFLVFLLAYSTVTISIGRIVSTFREKNLNSDPLYTVVPSLYWYYADGPVTLISVCIPAMISLARRVLGWYGTPANSVKQVSQGSSTQVSNRSHDNESQKNIVDATIYDLREWNTNTPTIQKY